MSAIQPVIFAGGRQTRWGVASSKHMVVVPREDEPGSNEPLLLRTLRLLGKEASGNGLPLQPAVVVARVDQEFHGMELYAHSIYPEFCGPNLGMSLENAGTYFKGAQGYRLLLMMGDVFWTPAALHAVCTVGPLTTLFHDGWDTFAIAADAEAIPSLLPAFRLRVHRHSLLATVAEHDIGDFCSFPILDRTQDFDIAHEYVQFMAGLSKNKGYQRTPEQRALRKKLGIRIKE